MGIISPLANFIDLIANIKQNASTYYARLSGNEASTRVALIDPALRALGWEMENPMMIEFEKTLPKSRVDYALYNQEGKIQVIIEAKALGTNLGDKAFVFNLIMYAIAANIKDIFLTDGVIWEHYADFSPGNVMSTKTIDINKDNLFDCAIFLVNKLDAAQFWQGKLNIEKVSDREIFNQINELRNEISNLKKGKAPLTIPPPPIVVPEKDFVELTALTVDLTGRKPPLSLRLPDGSTKEISKWRDILLECCRFVLDNTPSLKIPIPDASGKKVQLIGLDPLPEGIAQHKLEHNGQQLNIYTNYDSKHCVANAIHILTKLDSAKAKFKAAVRF